MKSRSKYNLRLVFVTRAIQVFASYCAMDQIFWILRHSTISAFHILSPPLEHAGKVKLIYYSRVKS